MSIPINYYLQKGGKPRVFPPEIIPLLLPELDGASLRVHGIHDGQRLQPVAQVAQNLTANLEALFNDNAQTFHGSAGGLGNGNQTLQGAAIGKKIVDNQKVVVAVQELFGDDDLILIFMGEGFHLCHIHLPIQVDGFGFLGKDHGHAEFLGYKAGDANAGGFNGQNLGDRTVCEAALEFPADFLHQRNVHLVIQKAVYLQYISRFDNAVFLDACF